MKLIKVFESNYEPDIDQLKTYLEKENNLKIVKDQEIDIFNLKVSDKFANEVSFKGFIYALENTLPSIIVSKIYCKEK